MAIRRRRLGGPLLGLDAELLEDLEGGQARSLLNLAASPTVDSSRGGPAPRELSVSHSPDEAVEIERLVEAAEVYALTAIRLSGPDEGTQGNRSLRQPLAQP